MALLVERFVIFLIMMSALQAASHGAVYKVGDSAGWTIIGNIDYRKWAAPKSFQVGDTIIFEYNAQFHNVMRVTHAMYKTCNASAPLATYTSGNDSITITNHGHHFFICGVPGHCQAGQKVDMNVLKANVSPTAAAAAAAAAAAPTPSSAMAPPVAVSNVHVPALAPSPNSATPLKPTTFPIMGLAVTILALAVPSFA